MLRVLKLAPFETVPVLLLSSLKRAPFMTVTASPVNR